MASRRTSWSIGSLVMFGDAATAGWSTRLASSAMPSLSAPLRKRASISTRSVRVPTGTRPVAARRSHSSSPVTSVRTLEISRLMASR